MKRTKQEKGITLIALIITIVVLLILAAVAISSITNDNILGYAQNAAKDYNQAVKNEQEILQGYVNYLSGHTGSTTTTYKAYTIGDPVTVGSETFYVIKNSSATEEKVLLLAKQNIDTKNLVQSASVTSAGFSTENYWGEVTTITDIVEPAAIPESHIAAKAAYDYGVKVGGTGRLMTYSEANDLEETNFSTKLYETNFWLGSANVYTDYVFNVYGSEGIGYSQYHHDSFGVRPVVEISKSKIS